MKAVHRKLLVVDYFGSHTTWRQRDTKQQHNHKETLVKRTEWCSVTNAAIRSKNIRMAAFPESAVKIKLSQKDKTRDRTQGPTVPETALRSPGAVWWPRVEETLRERESGSKCSRTAVLIRGAEGSQSVIAVRYDLSTDISSKKGFENHRGQLKVWQEMEWKDLWES